MNRIITQLISGAVLAFSLTQNSEAQGPPRRPAPPPEAPQPAGIFTTVSGTISQFNYDREGEPEGFKLKDNTLVHLPPRLAAKVESTVRPGDTIQVSGQVQTSPFGVQVIDAQTVQDRTSGKTIAEPAPGAPAPYSGSGKIKQLNYDKAGAVNGFLLENGTLVRVAPFSAANPSSIQTGAAIAYTGLARTTVSGRTVVDLDSLTIDGQTLRAAVPPTPDPAAMPAPPPPPAPSATPRGLPRTFARPTPPPPPPAPPVPPADQP